MVDGPLDMRMDASAPMTAADWLASVREEALADAIFQFGEERYSRRIARRIVEARRRTPIVRTRQLVDLVMGALPAPARHSRIHPATRTFQAIRMVVNDELGELERGLAAAVECLTPGGRLAVISFHSLEDRIVKRFLSPEKGGAPQSRHLPQAVRVTSPWRVVAKPVKAGATELHANPRSRSATLRAAVRGSEAARDIAYAGLGVPRAGGAA